MIREIMKTCRKFLAAADVRAAHGVQHASGQRLSGGTWRMNGDGKEVSGDDDLIQFLPDEDEAGETGRKNESYWPVLVLDDDPDVHVATRLALQDCNILGRRLKLYSAYSGEEAKVLLLDGGVSFACILLDVVMESEDAGLKLVDYIRNVVGDNAVRIVLRTGQPGYAPEMDVVSQYDINDYRSKSELTRKRLITTLTSAIRAYDRIRTIEENQQRLTRVVDSAPSLFRNRETHAFAGEVLRHLCALLDSPENGVIFAADKAAPEDLEPLAALGSYWKFAEMDGRTGRALDVSEALATACKERRHVFSDQRVVLYMEPSPDQVVLVEVEVKGGMDDFDRRLVELFSVTIGVGYDNARMFEQIEELAYTDEVTGLPSRAGMIQLLQKLMGAGDVWSVIIADIDEFQAVNDGLGRAMGDKVLVSVADLLSEVFGRECQLSRLSGDSFAVSMGTTDPTEIEKRINKLREKLLQGVAVEQYNIPMSVTMGVAQYPEHGSTPEELLQNASIAMKRAKQNRRSDWTMFSRDFDQELVERLELLRDLSRCIEREELELYFQPQLSLKDGRVTVVEALLRWHRKDKGIVLPGEFVSAAEDAGLIVSIGQWVLENACRVQTKFAKASGRSITVAVNVSMRQLRDPGFLSMLDDVIARTGANPEALELEITESMMVEDFEGVRVLLQAFQQRGIQVVIDDFGTGYSSLNYLKKLPVDRLKIDKSFVQGLSRETSDQVIPALIVEMSHMLSLGVVAEGVEGKRQEEILRELGCDDVQGYLYSEPMSARAMQKFLRRAH